MRQLYYVLLAALFAWQGHSQCIIGTGTATTNGLTADPVERYYNYTHSQIVYTAAELTAGGMTAGATISSLGFSISQSASSLANYTISLGHTSQAVATPHVTTGLQVVRTSFTYAPTVQSAGNFDMIAFTTSFVWNGTSNVVVNICTGSNPFTTPYGGLRVSTTATNQTNYVRTDTNANCTVAPDSPTTSRPNIRFNFTNPIATNPATCATTYSPATGATNVVRNPTLTWSGAGNGPTGYDVYFGTTSTPPLVSTNQTATSYTPAALAANTQYYYQVVPKNSVGAAIACSAVSFTTGSNFTYCSTTYADGCSFGDEIRNVSLGSLNNTSTCTTGSYTFYSAVTAPTLGQGSTNTLSITMGTHTTQYSAAWIDFNQNGAFEPSEGFTAAVVSGVNPATLSIVVPTGALLGNTRMRVRGGDDVAITTAMACGASNSTYGETEDYIVTIVAPLPPVQCVTLTYPGNGATNVPAPAAGIPLAWTPSATGPAATTYDLYVGLTATALTNLGSFSGTTVNLTGTAPGTTYYWRIIAKSPNGTDSTGCSTFSFTTSNPFAPYCSNVSYVENVEPITLVQFAGINNSSSATVDGTPAIQDFISVTGAVTTESTYQLTLKGNTAGAFTTNFRVWFDWNHNGTFEASERYSAGSVNNSTGLDAAQAQTNITVPASALGGATRMRVKKLFSGDGGSIDDPCTGGEYGQTEDYTVNVTVCTPLTWYADTDNDGFGNPAVSQSSCNQPVGYVSNGTDCNDSNAAVYQSGTFYVDADLDGYSSGVTATICYGATVPAGYIVDPTAVDCNDSVAAVNPGATEVPFNGIDDDCDGTIDEGSQIYSQVLPSQCGTTLANISSYIGAVSYSAPVDGYRFRVTNLATNAVQVIDKNVPNFQITQLAAFDYASTYSIEVQLRRNGQWLNYYGPACSVSTPAVLDPGGSAGVNPSQCNVTLASISTLIATTSLPNVTAYKFRITDAANNQSQELERSTNWFALTMLNSYLYGRTYSIEVSVKTNGQFSGYGQPCLVTSPLVPQIANCGATIAANGTIIQTTSLNRVTSYRFELTNLSTFTSDVIVRSQNYFTFNNFPGFVPGAQYSVRVSVMTVGAWSDYSEACSITAPGATRTIVKGEELTPLADFRAVVYPNPYSESFAFDMDSSSEEKVSVKVYDMLGKLVEEKEFSYSAIESQQFGERYPSGVYNVILTQGSLVKTLRVVKR
ncbi:GEVED domain-containing protein [Flavobacterium sp.]|uniref:GEVED domain-containing protein n=1 Tax=Flavobacterium sp. TaxID=239 RepID=UPI00122BB8C9|nr:GEVED domain-containing protein [Flavobacterium sp.]RZJ73514.1 MAG: T9SS type A sorting domain-containing protein [Flavobacterium sp.]